MPHIPIPEAAPGIRGLMAFRPEIAGPLNALADVLLHHPGSLTPGERELIATFVSARNDCRYCQTMHGAVAAEHLRDQRIVAAVKATFGSIPDDAAIPPKLRALLGIAEKVRLGGKHVSDADVAAARAEGASDLDLHDTVLIAAAFCMFNRYVDGLGARSPDAPDFYRQRAEKLASDGYAQTNADLRPARV